MRGRCVVTLILLLCASTVCGCPSLLCSCDHGDILDCSHRRLEKVPSWDDDTNEVYTDRVFRQVNLNNNDISSVQPSAFLGLHVSDIDLSNNQLIGISPQAFRDVRDTLQHLNMSFAGLQVLHWATFSDLHQLKTLLLSNNEFFAIPSGLFESLGSLESLDLSHNKIAALKEGSLRGLSSLVQLNLSDNKIASVEEGVFADDRRLASLNLNSNHITVLHQSTFKGLRHLQHLQINNNNISQIEDGAFAVLPFLQTLSLSGNNVSTIGSKTLHGLMSLRQLFLDGNVLHKISLAAFSAIEHLHELHAQNNYLTSLGEGSDVPAGLHALQTLELENNPLDCSCAISWIRVLSDKKIHINGACRLPVKYVGQNITKVDFSWCKPTTQRASQTLDPPTAGPVPSVGTEHPADNE